MVPLIVAVPLALAVLALLGYVHTAGTLMRSLVAELWLMLGLTVIQQLGVRWLTLSRRRLTLSAAGERLAAPGKEARQVDPPHLGPVVQVAEPEVDLAVLDTRTQTLVDSLVLVAVVVGLWGIYSEVLPALAILEDISLWTYTGTLDGREHMIPMTLADIGLTLLVTIIAAVAVRNLPAFLEIALLQRIAIRSRPSPAISSSSPPPLPSSVPSGSPGPRYSGWWPPSAWASVSACRRSWPTLSAGSSSCSSGRSGWVISSPSGTLPASSPRSGSAPPSCAAGTNRNYWSPTRR